MVVQLYFPSRATLGPHGITAAQYTALYLQQEGACAMCGYVPVLVEGKRFELEIDHDPSCCPNLPTAETKKNRIKACGNCVRGLLCQGCNIMLGRYERCKGTLVIPVFDEYIKTHGAKSELVDRSWRSAGTGLIAQIRPLEDGQPRRHRAPYAFRREG